ncbi:MAG: hypothetical protein ACP5JW_07235 [Candidatus Bathyarchaeia archaeon]
MRFLSGILNLPPFLGFATREYAITVPAERLITENLTVPRG